MANTIFYTRLCLPIRINPPHTPQANYWPAPSAILVVHVCTPVSQGPATIPPLLVPTHFSSFFSLPNGNYWNNVLWCWNGHKIHEAHQTFLLPTAVGIRGEFFLLPVKASMGCSFNIHPTQQTKPVFFRPLLDNYLWILGGDTPPYAITRPLS